MVQNYEPQVISKPWYMAQGACAAGHAWFWDYRGLIVWSRALNKAVNMCFIYRNNSKRMDLKKILHEKPGWIVLSGATNVQCHCCVTINSTARCANRMENARTLARSRNRLNHRTKEFLHVNQWRSQWKSIISLIPRLSHRLSYSPFRTISWSWYSSTNYFMARALSVRLPYNTWLLMCVAQIAVRARYCNEQKNASSIGIGNARIAKWLRCGA